MFFQIIQIPVLALDPVAHSDVPESPDRVGWLVHVRFLRGMRSRDRQEDREGGPAPDPDGRRHHEPVPR